MGVEVLPKENGKREDYISWDEYFMGIAMLSAERSKDPNTIVGACIVSEDNRILSMGYNGAPRGLHDDKMHWSRNGSFVDTKYAYVCHAELNAILNYRGDLSGSKLYVKLFPDTTLLFKEFPLTISKLMVSRLLFFLQNPSLSAEYLKMWPLSSFSSNGV